MITQGIPETESYLEPSGLFVAEYTADSSIIVILVPPLFEEHPRTRKLLVNTARFLANNNIRAIRFDYCGTGLSQGSANDLSLESTQHDLNRVCQYVTQQTNMPIFLLGLRYGGYLAMDALHHNDAVSGAILWEPITDLAKYSDTLLRIALTNQLVTLGTIQENKQSLVQKLNQSQNVLVNGYPMTSAFHRQCLEGEHPDFAPPADNKRLHAIFWKNKKTHQTFEQQGISSTLLSGIKTTWENIKFIDNKPLTLLQQTLEWLPKS